MKSDDIDINGERRKIAIITGGNGYVTEENYSRSVSLA
jgi:hypothetical protein